MGCWALLLLLLRLVGSIYGCAVPTGLTHLLKMPKRSVASPIVHSPDPAWPRSRQWRLPEGRSGRRPSQSFRTTVVLTDEEYFASLHPAESQNSPEAADQKPFFDGYPYGRLRGADEAEPADERSTTDPERDSETETLKSSADVLRDHLEGFLSDMRNDLEPSLKERARFRIFNEFLDYGLETRYQNFSGELYRELMDHSQPTSGVNIIGVLSGKHRRTPDDHLIVLGAHYDTFKKTKGVNDNGSGIAALLEAARVLTAHRCDLDYTVIFVALDMEEIGCVGSYYFVNDFLITSELLRDGSKFQGAIILDTILHYNDTLYSQDIPEDFQHASPLVAQAIVADGFRGNFLASMSRWRMDERLARSFSRAWHQQSGPHFGLHSLAIPLGPQPLAANLAKHLNFLRSDHVMFWYHSHPVYKDSLSAILLTDTGPFRGTMRECYHNVCDDATALTDVNLQFVQKTTDSLISTIVDLAKGSCDAGVSDAPITEAEVWAALQQLRTTSARSPEGITTKIATTPSSRFQRTADTRATRPPTSKPELSSAGQRTKEAESYANLLARRSWDDFSDQLNDTLCTEKTWRIIKALLDPTKTRSESNKAIQRIIHTFEGDDNELLKRIEEKVYSTEKPDAYDKEYRGEDNPHLDRQITREEVYAAAKAATRNTAAGADRIRNFMIRNLSDEAVRQLTQFINEHWEKGTVPEEWKHATVVMIPKPGTKLQIENLRPISLTSCLGKLFERIVTRRLQQHLEEKGHYPDSMSGFRAKLSAQDVLLQIKEEVLTQVPYNGESVIMALDVKDAFDNAGHAAIMEGLNNANCGKKIHYYTRASLSNRTVTVGIGELRG
ncbi:uncharacterized protein LOC144111498 [Amblyomma americanum]